MAVAEWIQKIRTIHAKRNRKNCMTDMLREYGLEQRLDGHRISIDDESVARQYSDLEGAQVGCDVVVVHVRQERRYGDGEDRSE